LAVRPISVRAETKVGGGLHPHQPTATCDMQTARHRYPPPGANRRPMGLSQGTRTGAALGRPIPLRSCGAGTCSFPTRRQPRVRPGQLPCLRSARSGACDEAPQTGCRAQLRCRSAADLSPPALTHVRGTPTPTPTRHMWVATRRDLGNGPLARLHQSATRASLCALGNYEPLFFKRRSRTHHLVRVRTKFDHAKRPDLSVLQTGSCPQAMFACCETPTIAVMKMIHGLLKS